MQKDKIQKALNSFNDKKILVIGDIMLDRYTYGNVTRVSPEAPIPVLKKTAEALVPGGAANVANNLTSLGATVLLCGVIGKDPESELLLNVLKEKRIPSELLIPDKTRSTIVKHRLVANNQQLLRVDQEVDSTIEKTIQQKLLAKITKVIRDVDGVILSDYAKGVFTPEFASSVIALARKYKKKTLADIKPANKTYFKGVDILTPNLKEAKEMTGLNDLEATGKSLTKFFNAAVIITRGEDGISVFNKNLPTVSYPAKKIEVYDVSGAGDTVVAVEMLCVISGLTVEEAAYVANFAGSVVVQKRGTATIGKEELYSILYEENHIEATNIVPKLWGYEKWIENNEKYCSKLLSVNKGYQCSLHYHKIKDEMFIVTKGHIRLEVDDKVIWMRPGNFYRIHPNTHHRFRGMEDSLIIEVSTTHADSDSYRIEESRKV